MSRITLSSNFENSIVSVDEQERMKQKERYIQQ